MRQPIRGEMPILLSLPLRFARRPRRGRRRRARGALILLIAAIVIALLASI